MCHGARRLSGVGLFSLTVLVLLGPAEAAVRVCKPSITGDEMTAATLEEARALALKSWKTLAELHGANYGAWRLATGRQIACRKLADNNHHCTAKASPCIISQTVPPDIGPRPRPKDPKGDIRI